MSRQRVLPGATDPTLRSGALLLRPFTLDDVAPIYRLSQEAGMRTWIPDQVYADEAAALAVLRYLCAQYGAAADPRNAPYVLAVCLAASKEVIGHVGFSACQFGVEVGYAIGEAHQRRGYARAAVTVAGAWALRRFALPELYAVVADDNTASCKVLDASGFRIQATLKRRLHGVVRAVRIYTLSAAPAAA